jgi:CRISPR-associated protein Csb1
VGCGMAAGERVLLPADTTTRAASSRGWNPVLARNLPGGVIADRGVRRDAFLTLTALRRLGTAAGPERTLALQRYVLGLALVAFTGPSSGYLREGCVLVPAALSAMQVVHGDGRRETLALTHADARAFALEAAQAFGIGPDRTVEFDPALAREDLGAKRTSRRSEPE